MKKEELGKNFTILDESDVQSLFKQIVTKNLNLDDKNLSQGKSVILLVILKI